MIRKFCCLSVIVKIFALLPSLILASVFVHSAEIKSVTPEFMKIRHGVQLQVDIENDEAGLQLSFMPGGPFVKNEKKTESLGVLHNSVYWQLEYSSRMSNPDLLKAQPQLVAYRSVKSHWMEVGFIPLKGVVNNIKSVGRLLLVATDDGNQFFDVSRLSNIKQIDSLSSIENIQLAHAGNQFVCSVINDELVRTSIVSQTTVRQKLSTEVKTLLNFQNTCITINNNNVVQLWAIKPQDAGSLNVVSSYQADSRVWNAVLSDNVLMFANSATGMTLLEVDANKFRWLGSYNKLNNITHIAYSKKRLIVADDKGILSLFDVKDFSAPLLISDFASNRNIQAINFNGQLVMLIAEDEVIDIDFSSNSPPTISTLGVNQGGSRRSTLHNDVLYVADWFSGLHLYDVRVPSSPRLLSSFHTPGSPKGVVVRNAVAFVADDDHGLQIIDVSDVRSPFLISELPLSGLAYTMKLRDNLLFIASHRGGFHIVDVKDVSNPQLISTFDTEGKSWALALKNNFLFVADDDSGLLVFDVEDPTQPRLVNQFDPGGFAEDVAIVDDKAYVAFFDNGLFVLDISQPLSIKQVSHIETPGNARGIQIQNNWLFLASWEAGVQIINIEHAENPKIVGHYDTKGAVWGLSVQGKYIYAMDWWGGVKILNAQDVSQPVFVAQYQIAGKIHDLIYSNKFIYTAHGSRGMQVYDANNDLNPVWATGVDLNGNAKAITINKKLALLAMADDGLAIVDIARPFEAKLMSQIVINENLEQVVSLNNLVFAAGKSGDLFLIDISQPTKPELLVRKRIGVKALQVAGGFLYVLSDAQTLTSYAVKNSSDIVIHKSYKIDEANQYFIVADDTIYLLTVDGKLQTCALGQKEMMCHEVYVLSVGVNNMQLANGQLLITTLDNRLYVFDLSDKLSPKLRTIYSTTHLISRISSSKGGIFFAGNNNIASGKLLPELDISHQTEKFLITIPDNMPAGAYHLVLTEANGTQKIKRNAFTVGFPKIKSRFTMEQFKAKMKQKNFAGKVPEAQKVPQIF